MKPKVKARVQMCILYAVMGLLALFFLFPFLYMFFKSVMGDLESAGSYGIHFFPMGAWYLSNYAKVFDSEFLRFFLNTALVIVCNIIGIPLSACICAYGFARGKFKSKGVWFTVVLATIMLPGAVTQVPLYLLYKALGLTGTVAPLIVPGLFGGGALNIFLAMQFIRSIPRDLDEAATIDGANRVQIFVNIIFPLLKPIIIYIAINTFISSWRDFDSALIYIGNSVSAREWQTLALGIYYRFHLQNSSTYPNMQMASGVLMVVPLAILFFIFQRQLIDGVMVTGLKD